MRLAILLPLLLAGCAHGVADRAEPDGTRTRVEVWTFLKSTDLGNVRWTDAGFEASEYSGQVDAEQIGAIVGAAVREAARP